MTPVSPKTNRKQKNPVSNADLVSLAIGKESHI
jgi:hypothetical protein